MRSNSVEKISKGPFVEKVPVKSGSSHKSSDPPAEVFSMYFRRRRHGEVNKSGPQRDSGTVSNTL